MIIEHAPQARCYRCGSPGIATFCHHCGRSMCGPHSSKAEVFKKLLSREFADLGLTNPQAKGYHCAEHDHVVKGGLRGLIWPASPLRPPALSGPASPSRWPASSTAWLTSWPGWYSC